MDSRIQMSMGLSRIEECWGVCIQPRHIASPTCVLVARILKSGPSIPTASPTCRAIARRNSGGGTRSTVRRSTETKADEGRDAAMMATLEFAPLFR